jgi:hypothetical protein
MLTSPKKTAASASAATRTPKRTPKPSPERVPKGSSTLLPESPAKRRLFAADATPAETYTLCQPDGSSWVTTSWDGAVSYAQALLLNAERLADGDAGALRLAAAAMIAGKRKGSKGPAPRAELCTALVAGLKATGLCVRSSPLLKELCLAEVVRESLDAAYRLGLSPLPFSDSVRAEHGSHAWAHASQGGGNQPAGTQ